MIFPSATFLFLFLPLVLAGYFLCPRSIRNLWLLLASISFYTWGAPSFVLVLLGSSILDYFLSLLFSNRNRRRNSVLLFISITANVALLAYFKYANFFIGQLRELGLFHGAWISVALPVGISFFTFHKISYVVDVYKGTSKASRNVFDYLLYITFFPQLIAGPIVRYHEIESFLTNRTSSIENVFLGIQRFCFGMAKKMLIADPSGAIAHSIFSAQPGTLSTPYCWLGAVAYSIQLYFDFSGYSDMAIGLAKMFGFSFPENFNQPYLARNFTDFWRRWHISLSRWMRDYLYIPLGGSHHGTFKTYRNLWIVFLLSGLWHGANWTFIVWGAYHGLFLVLDRMGLERLSLRLPAFVSIFLTYCLVLIGWVLFRSESLQEAWNFLQVMFSPFSSWEAQKIIPYGLRFSRYESAMLITGLTIAFLLPFLKPHYQKFPSSVRASSEALASLLLLFLSLLALASGQFSPFIYFRF